MMEKQDVAVIGGGPSALMFAALIDIKKYNVTIYEKNKSIARKFLVAGKGGFNLTHSENVESMKNRFSPPDWAVPYLDFFDNSDLRSFLSTIGIASFVGSSKRVYPTAGIKPIEVLNAFRDFIKDRNVQIAVNHKWVGWGEKGVLFDGVGELEADYYVFCLGGSSWKITGSDGLWSRLFEEQGIQVLPFKPANCRYMVDWPKLFIENVHGSPLKNIEISCGGLSKKGEVVVTKDGIEGGAIYALTNSIQAGLDTVGKSDIYIDLKTNLSKEEIVKRLGKQGRNITDLLRREIKLEAVKINMLKSFLTKSEYTDVEILANKVKSFPLSIVGSADLDEAISTFGGINLEEVSVNLELMKMEGTFVIGEMLDWNAPTGGYLLQGCFSMGAYLAHYFNEMNK